ncbi:MAG: glutamate formimidoyltransferase [Anaerolineae bacterium]|nr:glutamate formimidoyltransferase [Anaerolineae bacterium]
MPLVECVPNFSEGQRADVIAALADAIRAAPVALLDVSSDADHNRTVITFAGEPEPVADAMLSAARVAVERIDLAQHRGVHPRIGAVDVIPFVPLRGISLTECAALARSFGRRLARTLDIPIYLYEAAALRPDRVNLANVRNLGYEALHTVIHTPERAPDFGPARLTPAGAVAVGARGPLVAFNAYLDTDDVSIADSIAQSIRASGGGLLYLKALGLLVGGRAQVSMNVIDYRKTSLFTIMETLRDEAKKHGVAVTHTELVGLVPQAVLLDFALAGLQLPPSARDQVLEHRLGAATGDYREVAFE